MKSGLFNCVVILKRLRDNGHTGGITIIKDYVNINIRIESY